MLCACCGRTTTRYADERCPVCYPAYWSQRADCRDFPPAMIEAGMTPTFELWAQVQKQKKAFIGQGKTDEALREAMLAWGEDQAAAHRAHLAAVADYRERKRREDEQLNQPIQW